MGWWGLQRALLTTFGGAGRAQGPAEFDALLQTHCLRCEVRATIGRLPAGVREDSGLTPCSQHFLSQPAARATQHITMGNDLGKGANRVAIAAMANVTSLEKKELLKMQKQFLEVAQVQGNPNTITKAEFAEALSSVGVSESDREILDRLFIMLDKTGDYQINFREFIVGVAPLITGTVIEKLNFAFELYDADGTGEIKPTEMRFVLKSMNSTASYFGDPVMTQEQIDQLVDDIFQKYDKSETGSLNYTEFMDAVAGHDVLVSFTKGQGTVRYGTAR